MDHGLPAPQLFAYPFSANMSPTDDPAAASRTADVVGRLFAAGLVDSATAGAMTSADVQARVLRRVDVGTATTTHQLFDLVTKSTASLVPTTRPLAVPERWRDAAYALVARSRYRWFGKVDHCALLTPEQRARLL